MLDVINVSVNFSGQPLFKDVNLKFTPGNCYGVIGANGAGKSTFLRVLSGNLEPTTGDVAIKKGARMSVLKQDHFAYDEYTVLDTVIMGNKHLYDVMKEKDALYQDAKADTISAFLAVYDNLERAAASEGGEDSPHKKGLEMIFTQFKEILQKQGVTEMETLGKPFDPEKMNAVMHIDDENLGENVVAQVFQAGFMLGDKVIRHAIVQVAN